MGNVEIVHWEDEKGESPVTDFYLTLPSKHQAWIAKRDTYFENYTFPELMATPYLEKIEGTDDLWELKYLGKGGRCYRMICIFCSQKLIGLVLFKGSGSGGKVTKHIALAESRALSWKVRNSKI